jgi:hypothetical protein
LTKTPMALRLLNDGLSALPVSHLFFFRNITNPY